MRDRGFEPLTPSVSRKCSTTELTAHLLQRPVNAPVHRPFRAFLRSRKVSFFLSRRKPKKRPDAVGAHLGSCASRKSTRRVRQQPEVAATRRPPANGHERFAPRRRCLTAPSPRSLLRLAESRSGPRVCDVCDPQQATSACRRRITQGSHARRQAASGILLFRLPRSATVSRTSGPVAAR